MDKRSKLKFSEFDLVYQSSVNAIWPHWNTEMQAEIARHCIAWSPGRTDFLNYLQASSIRFYHAYIALFDSGGRTVCDIGGFWGVWPMTAKKLGFEVAMTESLRFYGQSFAPLFDQIASSGVEIFDYDPFAVGSELPSRFDLVTVMAVLEHYPHSLKTFIANVKSLTAPNGRIYIEAPNIAFWPKRLGLLFGRTPLAPLADIYGSEAPFIGHHHEFTIEELRDLERLGGLRIIAEKFYNYSLADANKFKLYLRHPAMSLALVISPTCRECISILFEIA